MIKKRWEIIALAIVSVALILYVVFRNTDRIQYETPTLETLDKEAVTGIQYIQDEKEIFVKKTEGTWNVLPNGYPADEAKINKMIDAVADLELVDLISEKEVYPKYELDEEGRMVVNVFNDDEVIRTFYVGKTSSTRRYTYVLLPDDPNVYSVGGNLQSTFVSDEEQLHDKQIFSFDAANIYQIRYNNEESFTLTKELSDASVSTDSQQKQESPTLRWVDSEGTEWEQQKVEDMLRPLSSLRCTKYKDRPEDAERLAELRLSEEGGAEYTLTVFEKDDDGYPAVSNRSDFQFYLSTYNVENIADFFIKE